MASPGVTLSGTLTNPGGIPTAGVVAITLVNNGGFPPLVSGTALLDPLIIFVQAAANGAWSTPLWGNDQISPQNTVYQVNLFPEESGVASTSPIWSAYYIFNTGSYDLSTQTPVSLSSAPILPFVSTTIAAQSAPANNFFNGINPTGTFSYSPLAASGLSNGTTGTGLVVLATSPALAAPALGAATATSINKVAITAPASSATLAIANTKTLAANSSLTLAGVDAKTLTVNNSITIAGTDGKALTVSNTLALAGTDGTTQTFPASPPAGGAISYGRLASQAFAAPGGFTFTIPAGVTAVKVTVVGGGGAGGGATTTANASGTGGGGAGAAIKWLAGLAPGNTLAVFVGSGGTGSANAVGGAGTNSTVSSGTQTISTITANAGSGGAATGNVVGAVAGGASGGDINLTGGQPCPVLNSTSNAGGNGGAAIFSGAGGGGFTGAGAVGASPGAGGGGAGGGAGGAVAGGNGAAGIVLFEWAA